VVENEAREWFHKLDEPTMNVDGPLLHMIVGKVEAKVQ